MKYWYMIRDPKGGGTIPGVAKSTPDAAEEWASNHDRKIAARGHSGTYAGTAWEFGLRSGVKPSGFGKAVEKNPSTIKVKANPDGTVKVQMKKVGSEYNVYLGGTRVGTFETAEAARKYGQHLIKQRGVFVKDRADVAKNPAKKIYVVTYFYANGTRNREYFTVRAEADKQLRKYYRNHKGGHGEVSVKQS